MILLYGQSLDQKPVTKNPSKTYDTTPFDEALIDKVCSMKKHVDALNCGKLRKDKITQDDIRNMLNTELGLDKSTSAYRRIWNEHLPFYGEE